MVFGAFGAHKLKDLLAEAQLQSFETGVRYQFYHVFAAFWAAWLAFRFPGAGFELCGWLFVAGIVLFSGSIYLLACRDLLQLGKAVSILGPVTPVGGLVLLSGWVLLALRMYGHLDQQY